MKNIVLTGLVSISLLTACNKQDQKVEGPTLEQQKLEYQAKQLDIEKQKLAIEKEKFAFEQQKKTDSLEKAKQTAVAKTASTQKNYYAGNTNYTPRKKRSRSSYNNSGSSGSYANNGNSGYSNAGVQQPQKKGMSSAAKGAIIGTVGGAAAGALISKGNRGAGAVIGGVLGAGTGYVIGRANDRKTGRVQPRY
ncbi:hypothetical protein KRE40_12330 [Elizabethkingia meningoseptica]|uniref:Glycine zipper domain-containing protein n=1 Tax=Elizabethkingia meningoseptica TaxID=238 RepID=A0A1V3U637_ELIME|nr:MULTISPECIES: glycine zipper domain-containing protein [Elizabethkingia]AQX11449.1 hypothetical protein BBD35_03185 [Elizabethkingia meningoseptica]EJK5329211.1 hypothetical protein [Elizabethkingia meningoseptica]MBG0512796.1 hypothetical protein [Elizabethkingia meningoseptica]MDE5432060.1 hypothetical protein [Elizabethkingia meningoseptica]MDE5435398.1 hypothetical protein [Elizabethkingia meningoseptica]